jgi:methyl-accepting chemotaxis protein
MAILLRLRIGQRLALTFGFLIVMMVAMLTTSVTTAQRAQGNLTQTLGVAQEKTRYALVMRDALHRAATYVRNIGLLTDVPMMNEQSAKVVAAMKAYSDAESSLRRFALDRDELALLDGMDAYRKASEPLVANALALSRAFSPEEAGKVLITKLAPVQERWMDDIEQLMARQSRFADASLAATFSANQRVVAGTAAAGVASILVAIFAAWFLSRSITRPLARAVDVAHRVAAGDLTSRVQVEGRDEMAQLMTALQTMNDNLSCIVTEVREATDTIAVASTEISSGNNNLSTRTESQASSLQQTAASIAQLAQTVRANADDANQADRLAGEAANIADRGGNAMHEVVANMGAISKGAGKVVEIISVIDGIAFQTNILALNAAVEAARAGENGRGFAVVASEVRSLSQRTSAAAKEIEKLIRESASNIEHGAALVSDAGKTVESVVHSVRSVTGLMQRIATASHEQTRGIEEVDGAVQSIDEMTQQNAALVEQASAAAASLDHQAQRLAKAVGSFRLQAQPA